MKQTAAFLRIPRLLQIGSSVTCCTYVNGKSEVFVNFFHVIWNPFLSNLCMNVDMTAIEEEVAVRTAGLLLGWTIEICSVDRAVMRS